MICIASLLPVGRIDPFRRTAPSYCLVLQAGTAWLRCNIFRAFYKAIETCPEGGDENVFHIF